MRSTLADVNERCDWRIYFDVAQVLIDKARRLYVDEAFAHRRRRFMTSVAALYERADDASEHEAGAERAAGELRQGEPGAYVGFMGEAGEARVREAYPGPTWDRLAAVKARYDPTNLFRVNQNVPPAEAGRA